MIIQSKYKHGKFGTFMFNLCASWTKFLICHRVLYYFLACTWGIIMTLLGVIITIILAIAKIIIHSIKFKKYRWIYSISVKPNYWGGLEMGLMYLRDIKSSNGIDAHEFGHTFQNCLLGPLFPLLIGIPSALRYWYRELRARLNLKNKPYDSMWFEDSASQCGEYASRYLK